MSALRSRTFNTLKYSLLVLFGTALVNALARSMYAAGAYPQRGSFFELTPEAIGLPEYIVLHLFCAVVLAFVAAIIVTVAAGISWIFHPIVSGTKTAQSRVFSTMGRLSLVLVTFAVVNILARLVFAAGAYPQRGSVFELTPEAIGMGQYIVLHVLCAGVVYCVVRFLRKLAAGTSRIYRHLTSGKDSQEQDDMAPQSEITSNEQRLSHAKT